MSDIAVEPLLEQLYTNLSQVLTARQIDNPALVGIHSGGAWVAQQLHARMQLADPLGTLDISFYRDDFTRVGINPTVKPSQIPFSVDDRHLVLVDDVLFTGRTVRAALNELFDYGRPASILLAVLVDRGGRELPIAPDAIGGDIALAVNEQIKLSGPEPLLLERMTVET
jgi:pyrimidine operon attenuation protein/uracil phosphoribosyltransferase